MLPSNIVLTCLSSAIIQLVEHMVFFHCFRDGKCEWLDGGLRGFVAQFNEAFGKDYDLSKCPDIYDRTRKQPEVLLESKSLNYQPVVIERKKVVYPDKYYEKHRLSHDFFACFRALYEKELEPHLHKGMYELRIGEDALGSYTKRKLPVLSKSIIEHISNNLKTFLINDRISSNAPISWCFRQIPPEPDALYDSGLEIWTTTQFSASALAEAEKGIKSQLIRHLPAIDQKFQEYAQCLKILVLEICGDAFSIPSLDEIVEMVNSADIPSSIDQIWLAEPQDESGSLITYHRILISNGE